LTGFRDPRTFRRVYAPDPEKKMYLTLFAQGYEYKLFGLIPTNRHLIGVRDGAPRTPSFSWGPI
jgi:peptide/nickel transport system permease protein